MVVASWQNFELDRATGLTLRVASHDFQFTLVVLTRLGDVQMPHSVISQLVASTLQIFLCQNKTFGRLVKN